MKETIQLIKENWPLILSILVPLYEVVVRKIPTSSPWWSILHILGTVISNNAKQGYKHITIIALFVLFSLPSFGQLNATYKAYFSVNTDSATVRTQTKNLFAAYGKSGALYFNKQSDKWRVSVDTVWRDLFASGGSGSNIYTGTSPTTITVGGLNSGSAILGQTYTQILQSILVPYINPVFTSFTNTQTTPVETGITLSGSKTFTWGITLGSGTVPTIDIFDNTASSTLLAGTPNDGTQAVTITTIQLNSSGATQSWKGVGNNTTPSGTFNSSNYVVTAYFSDFYGATAAAATTSAQVRALPSNRFQTPGANTFILNTGTTLQIFQVDLPPGITITQVIDLDALNANITSQYVATGTIAVNDAGSTPRTYNNYVCTLGSPYSSSHRHQITTN